jgi:hypothetical protein
MNYNRLVLFICLWICLQIHPVFACRYNIRETGFVDLGSDPYYFYGYVRMDTPEEITLKFDQILNSAFRDCNINAEMINVDNQKDHEALKFISLWQIDSFPAAVLVSPEGQSMAIDLNNDRGSFERSLRSAINKIISSPVREEIIEGVIKTYGVILFIEGEDTKENEKCRKAVSSAIGDIRLRMKMMVKSIEYPPVLITLKPESFSDEKILLWSLGLDESVVKPHAAVFYGKARWIGPLMKAGEIEETNLEKILSIIGLDCECGLDVSWVAGTLLPLKWDQNRQAKVAGLLEFDPENPLVKLEVNRILKRASSSYPGVPVMFADSVAVKSDQVSDGYVVDEKRSYLKIPLYFTLGLVTLIILTGLIILYKVKKNQS